MSLVILERPGFESRAALLSEQLSLPLLPANGDAAPYSLALSYTETGLQIAALDGSAGAVRVDFTGGANLRRFSRGGGRGQQLAKAAGLGRRGFRPYIVDATAGLGRDGFVLASLGASVAMVERHPVVYALLEDGLARAAQYRGSDKRLVETIARIRCFNQPAQAFLEQAGDKPDIVYLDPMFPPRSKSARVKKDMQLLHRIVGHADNSEALLDAAMAGARYRVVVKRPAHAPALGGIKPSVSLKGKSTRFDVYTRKRIPKN